MKNWLDRNDVSGRRPIDLSTAAVTALLCVAFSFLFSQGPWALTVLLTSPHAYDDVQRQRSSIDPSDSSEFGVIHRRQVESSIAMRVKMMWGTAILGAAMFFTALVVGVFLIRSLVFSEQVCGWIVITVCVALIVITIIHRDGAIYNNKYEMQYPPGDSGSGHVPIFS